MTVLLFLAGASSCPAGPLAPNESICESFPELRGPYLGLDPPNSVPVIFAPFIASPEHHKHSAPAFSPEGDELFFSVYLNYEYPQRIYWMKQVEGRWTEPVLAPFSGLHQDGGPVFSPDGNTLFFYSKRPRPGETDPADADIWLVERAGEGWSEPRNPGSPLNSPKGEYSPFLSETGDFFFSVKVAERDYDVFRCTFDGDEFSDPEPLSAPINQPGSFDFDLQSDPGGRLRVLSTFLRDGREESELFVQFRERSGDWSPWERMAKTINEGGARFPRFSPDGKYFFFASYRSGAEEVHWVEAKSIVPAKE